MEYSSIQCFPESGLVTSDDSTVDYVGFGIDGVK